MFLETILLKVNWSEGLHKVRPLIFHETIRDRLTERTLDFEYEGLLYQYSWTSSTNQGIASLSHKERSIDNPLIEDLGRQLCIYIRQKSVGKVSIKTY